MWSLCAVLLLLMFSVSLAPAQTTVRFAVDRRLRLDSTNEQNVANIIASQAADIIITTGDNNYPSGSATTIDCNIGRDYHNYIAAYTGSYTQLRCRQRTSSSPRWGTTTWTTAAWAHPTTTTSRCRARALPPATPRAMSATMIIVVGPVHFFVINSDPREPNGTHERLRAGAVAASATGCRHRTMEGRLLPSPSVHIRAYTSLPPQKCGGRSKRGAHRLYSKATTMFTNASCGTTTPTACRCHISPSATAGTRTYAFGTPVEGSITRRTGEYGTVIAEASESTLNFKYYSYGAGGAQRPRRDDPDGVCGP